jgi:hypothetical protein
MLSARSIGIGPLIVIVYSSLIYVWPPNPDLNTNDLAVVVMYT